jgi:hypothetical protein
VNKIAITQQIITDGVNISWKNNNSIKNNQNNKNLQFLKVKKYMNTIVVRISSVFTVTLEIINNSYYTNKDFKYYSYSI